MKKKRRFLTPGIEYPWLRKKLSIMKLTTIILLVTNLSVSASLYSQKTQLSLKFSDISYEELFQKIEEQTKFRFAFSNSKLDRTQRLEVNVKKESIEETLDKILPDEITYEIIDRYVVILNVSEKKITNKSQQQITIKGKIIDSEGAPLPGVNVVEKGTTNGAVSNLNGEYTISVTSKDVTLSFSFVGYLTEEIEIGGQTTIDVTLVEDITSLDEVVVVGYGTVTKENLTTAVTKVEVDDIPVSANNSVNQLLFGRAAGLNAVQQSAEPGGAIDLSIRGRGNPLIIIDGIRVPNSGLEPGTGQGEINGVHRGGIADLNPADIESIEVLKDASASIYGIAASEGVILITTKKGKAGKMNVSYNASRSFVSNMKYLEPLSASEYMSYFNYFAKERYLFNNNMVPYGTTEASGFSPKYSDEDIANATNQTDWLDEVLRTGSIDNHTLTLNGGTEKLTYYFSGNYFDQTGTMKNSGLTRYNTRMNTTYKLAKFLKLNTNIGYTRNKYLNSTAGWQTGGSGTNGYGALQAAVSYPRTLPIKDEDGNYNLFSTTGNPVALLDINDKTNSSTVLANISLDIDIIQDKLFAKLQYGNNYEMAERSFYVPSDVFWGQIYQARGTLSNAQRQSQTMEGTLTYKDKIGDIVEFDAIAGMGQYIDDYSGNMIVATDMLDALNTDNIGAAPNISKYSSYRGYEKRRSYFATGNFNILDRYLVSLIYRLDGIDKFYPDNKYDGFPSASLGWKISNEPFMQGLTFLNLLKVRASLGITGAPNGTEAYGVYVADGNQEYFDNGGTIYTTYYQSRFNQPDLKWQKTVNSNIGIDIGLFNNRVSLSADVFKDRITNLVTQRATDQLSYIASVYENDGALVRNGFDIALRSSNISSKNVGWNTTLNISHYLYRWDERYENSDLQPFVDEKDPVNAIYVYETDGILQIGDTPSDYQPTGATLPGNPVFVDQNNDGLLDENDVVMYNSDPKLIVGFGNEFTYKQFDLGIFLYGQFGAMDFNYGLNWADGKDLATETAGVTQEIKDVWRIDNPDGIYPGYAYDETTLGLPASVDDRLASKDFVRCRNITLGYTVSPKNAINNYFKDIRVYLDIQNPFIITDYVALDPEVQAPDRKGAAAPYPMARTLSLGMNVNF